MFEGLNKPEEESTNKSVETYEKQVDQVYIWGAIILIIILLYFNFAPSGGGFRKKYPTRD